MFKRNVVASHLEVLNSDEAEIRAFYGSDTERLQRNRCPPDSRKRSRAHCFMNDIYIRNRERKIIGRMDGNWLRGGTVKLVARYDNLDNRTRDRTGRILGTGDLRLFQLGKDQPDK